MAEKTYKDGLEEAWKIAQEILDMQGYTPLELDEIFGGNRARPLDLVINYSIHEVKEKIEKWKIEKSKPKHGDVVILSHKSLPTSVIGIFLYENIYTQEYWLLSPEHECPQSYDVNCWNFKKTKKHFDIKGVLESLKGEL